MYLKIAIILGCMTLLSACNKNDAVTQNTETTTKEVRVETPIVMEKENNDIALNCTYSDPSFPGHQLILISSDQYKVNKFGAVGKDGVWKPEYRLNSVVKDVSSVTFSVTSYDWMFVQKINPNTEIPVEKLTINRSTLNARYESQSSRDGFNAIDYKCELLEKSLFDKYVSWVNENTKEIQSSNKI